MSRLFISHSSKDNVQALAFQHWLIANGWNKKDIFLDLHRIGAGERWRDTLRKANTACEAVVLLASPDALDSKECQREINLAEDLGKEIIVAILRDLGKTDARLAYFADRQIVDLSARPTECVEQFQHEGRTHSVAFHGPALASIKARLNHLGIAPDSFAWTPKERAGPYPGLAALSEDDAGIFFGRDADIMAGITELRLLRKRGAPRLLVIQAASGAGKSSFLRAGLWPRLQRDPDFVPLAILRPALGILTGPDGLACRLAPWFKRHDKIKLAGDIQVGITDPMPEKAAATLSNLLAEVTELATIARRIGAPDARVPAVIIGIDQGEELFAPENEEEASRLLELMAIVLRNPPNHVDPYILLTIRADSMEAMLQRWPALELEAPRSLYLPPLSATAYRDVIIKPAEVFSERVRRLTVEPQLASTLVNDASGADALPLLAFTLEKLFTQFGEGGELTKERYDAMGGIGGSIDRVLTEARRQAGASGSIDNLRRLVVPALATWDPEASAAKRLVVDEAHLTQGHRAALAPLADALVKNRLLTRGAGTLEVAHEALLRRAPIAGWLEEQKDALKLRDDVLKEAKEWASGGRQPEGLVRRGARLENALALQAQPDFAHELEPARDYLDSCKRLETAGLRKARRSRTLVTTLLLCTIAGLLGVLFKEPIGDTWFEYMVAGPYIAAQVHPHVLKPEEERSLVRGQKFRECAKNCPEMVVIPAGTFKMGSPPSEKGRPADDEGPMHSVVIGKAFAVGRYEVTWDEWQACVTARGCDGTPIDAGYGKGRKPVIHVSWKHAKAYVGWLSRATGKDYRLLTEAEWEYAARAETETIYSFGDDPQQLCRHANLADVSFRKHGYTEEIADCDDGHHETATVGSFAENQFGLFDVHGNVWEWVEDCYVKGYANAPSDGRAVSGSAECSRVIRGGSWWVSPQHLRSARRELGRPDNRNAFVGFRIARTLEP